MRLLSPCLVAALCAVLAFPAPAVPAAPVSAPSTPAPRPALAAPPAVPRAAAPAHAPRERNVSGAHIRIGCALLPRQAPRPIVVVIPSITVVVISVCWNPQDLFRARRA